MIPLPSYRNRMIGILGLGSSGMACCRALRAAGAQVICHDDRKEPHPEWPRQTAPSSKKWQSLDALVASPGFSLLPENAHPLIKQARDNNIPIIGDFELFATAYAEAKWQAPVIAVTGTNGKSTTAALIAHLLQAHGMKPRLGGNIGEPVLNLSPPDAGEKGAVYVLEISSYQIDLAPSFAPTIAVQTNLAPDHVERYGSMEAYAASKAALFLRAGANTHAVLGIDDSWGQKLATQLAEQARPPITFRTTEQRGQQNGIFVERGVLYENPTGKAGAKNMLGALPGILSARQNWQNAAAAYAVASQLGLKTEKALDAMASFKTLPHRMEEVANKDGIKFINDSKATNAAATAAVLQQGQAIYWIAGGRAKAEGFAPLRKALEQGDVKQAFVIGEAAETLAKLIRPHAPVRLCATLDEAVAAAGDAAKQERQASVLFSPACASFDAYDDFAARGEAFRAAVSKWQHQQPARSAKPERLAPPPPAAPPLPPCDIAIAAGGTGGHVLPAQALAAELKRRGHRPQLFTDRRALGMVNPDVWHHIAMLPAAPVAGKGLLGALMAIKPSLLGIMAARRFLHARRPAAIIGFGGYVSVPPMLAAHSMGIPCLIHQQGRHVGYANRLLSRIACAIATAFPQTQGFPEKQTHKQVMTGMPMRPEILQIADKPYVPPATNKPFYMLVFGGSQGASMVTKKILEALALLPDALRQRIILTIQCREQEMEFAHHTLEKLGLNRFYLASFLPDIARHMARSHLVLARAGALSVSELAAVARPSILIPITGAPQKEQTANAELVSKAGAGWLTHESGLAPRRLAERIVSLAATPDTLMQASEDARRLREHLSYRDAARHVAQLIERHALHVPQAQELAPQVQRKAA